MIAVEYNCKRFIVKKMRGVIMPRIDSFDVNHNGRNDAIDRRISQQLMEEEERRKVFAIRKAEADGKEQANPQSIVIGNHKNKITDNTEQPQFSTQFKKIGLVLGVLIVTSLALNPLLGVGVPLGLLLVTQIAVPVATAWYLGKNKKPSKENEKSDTNKETGKTKEELNEQNKSKNNSKGKDRKRIFIHSSEKSLSELPLSQRKEEAIARGVIINTNKAAALNMKPHQRNSAKSKEIDR